jgi:wobble nucleotide-excising tRNase
MSQSLTEIAQQLKNSDKRVQLIYAFNGNGKTRLSRKFKELVAPNASAETEDSEVEEVDSSHPKILYYNAFTEDLFTWNNDHDDYLDHSLSIRSNGLTDWLLPLLKDQGLGARITHNFQEQTNTKITPVFNEDYSEIRFNLALGGNNNVSNLKISKGEESNFIWSVFYSMLDLATSVLSEADLSNRETDDFNDLQYVFIDDPVSSLDENHLIHTAVTLAKLVKMGSRNLQFIISTHNPLFFNVLSKEFSNDRWDRHENGTRYWRRNHFEKYHLEKLEDGTHRFETQSNDASFSYHLHIKKVLKKAIDENNIERYHFNLLRNLLEKTATFLGHNQWQMLLPKNDSSYPDEQCMRALNVYSHSQHSGDEMPEPTQSQITKLVEIFDHLIDTYRFNSEIRQPTEASG